jgi:hypothetical protein
MQHYVSSTNKTDRRDIVEILLKVVLNTITLKLYEYNMKQNQEKHRTTAPTKVKILEKNVTCGTYHKTQIQDAILEN